MRTIVAHTPVGVNVFTQDEWKNIEETAKVDEYIVTPYDKEVVDLIIDDIFDVETCSLRVSNPNDWRPKKMIPVWKNVFTRVKSILEVEELVLVS